MKKALALGLLVLLAGSTNVSAETPKATKVAPKSSTAKTVAKIALTTAIVATAAVAATYGLDYALQWADAKGYITNDNACAFVSTLHNFIATVNANAVHAYTVASGTLTSAYTQAQPYAHKAMEKAATYFGQAKEFVKPYAHQAMDLAKTGLNKAQGLFAGLYNAGKNYFKTTTCPIQTNTCSIFEGVK